MNVKTMASAAVILLVFLSSGAFAQGDLTAERVLKKAIDKLAVVKTLTYVYRREMNYASEGFHNVYTAEGLLVLNAPESERGFKYHFSTADNLSVYNGSECFSLDKKKKTFRVKDRPAPAAFNGESFLYNSPLMLKIVLPKIASDSSIAKTLTEKEVAGEKQYVVEFKLHKATFGNLGDLNPFTIDRMSVYRIAFDKKTLLPVEVYLGNSKDGDFTRTTFTGMNVDAIPGDEKVWFYSNYTKDYSPEKPVVTVLKKAGETAPAFDLKNYGADTRVSLDAYKGKVVLLEFWIAHCGYCIAAVSKINVLKDKFKTLEIAAINIHDPDTVIGLFSNKNKPNYRILSGGARAAAEYGVSGYPTFFLIGKDGKVLYSNVGLDALAEIERLLPEHLQ